MKLNTRDYIYEAFFVEKIQLLGRGGEWNDALLTGSLSSFDHSSSLIRLVTKLQLKPPAPKIQDNKVIFMHPD